LAATAGGVDNDRGANNAGEFRDSILMATSWSANTGVKYLSYRQVLPCS